MATTLSEILQAKGDADYSQGGEGGAITKPDYTSAAANEYLQHAADLTFNAHRYLAEQHDQNMRETLKGLNDVDFKDLLPQDSQGLMGEYTGVIQDTANNFGVIRNPLSNPQQYAALKAKESGFRQKLSQAQQDAAFLKKQAEFVQVHPEFNTPAYQENVKKFMETPVGQRQPFVVTPPLTFNPAATYKTIAELAKKKYANAATNGKYITQEEGEKTDPTQYAALATGPLAGVDQYGNSLETARKASFDNLPANLKAGYKDYNDYVQRQAAMYMPQDQVSKKDIKGDRFGEITAEGAQQRKTVGMEEAFQGKQNELNRENALVIAGLKGNGKDGKIDKNATGAYVNKIYHDMVTGSVTDGTNYKANLQNPNVSNELLQQIYGDNTPVEQDTAHKLADKDAGTSTTATSKEKIPKISIVGNKMTADGRVFIMRRNNLTGKAESPLYVDPAKFYNDLSGILGEKNAPVVQQAAKEWLQKNTGAVEPDVNKLHNIFAPNSPGINTTAAPAANDPLGLFK